MADQTVTFKRIPANVIRWLEVNLPYLEMMQKNTTPAAASLAMEDFSQEYHGLFGRELAQDIARIFPSERKEGA